MAKLLIIIDSREKNTVQEAVIELGLIGLEFFGENLKEKGAKKTIS